MAAPPFLDSLYDAEEMRAVDRWAIEQRGVPGLDLMERAGTGLAQAVRDVATDGPIRIVCGKGNNGGDGLVAARLLREGGANVEILLLWPAAELGGDAEANFGRWRSAGGKVIDLAGGEVDGALAGSGCVVDAIFGTGFSGAPGGLPAEAIEAISGCGAPVVAADVPSGVDAATGEVEGAAVVATLTATFHGHKLGLWVAPGKWHAGEVRVVGIGVPEDDGDGPGPPRAGLLNGHTLDLPPRPGPEETKFSSGVVVVVGGSIGLTGAVCLASEAALRAGAGYVQAVVPASLNAIFEQKLTEVMTIPVVDDAGHHRPEALGHILEASERATAVVLGPGLGRAAGARELAREVVSTVERPLLIDADALNALGGALGLVAERPEPTVLTPHAGELARLLGTTSEEVGARRLEHARAAAGEARAVVVLKGDDSIVADGAGGRLAVNRGATPALATAGTGDVLSGITGACLAKGLDAFEAACAGVYVQAQAGIAAAGRRGVLGTIASDVIDALPGVLA